MDRRDFLLLRHPASPRTVEMSCERLHMSYLDLQAASAPAPLTISGDGPSFSEPQAIVPRRNIEGWLSDLEAELHNVDVIRVIGAEWLRPEALRAHIDALLERARQRGVRIDRPV